MFDSGRSLSRRLAFKSVICVALSLALFCEPTLLRLAFAEEFADDAMLEPMAVMAAEGSTRFESSDSRIAYTGTWVWFDGCDWARQGGRLAAAGGLFDWVTITGASRPIPPWYADPNAKAPRERAPSW